jgi:hypothetical protein
MIAAAVQLLAAPLCWVSPWIGYVVLFVGSLIAVTLLRPLPEAEEEMIRQRQQPPAPETAEV